MTSCKPRAGPRVGTVETNTLEPFDSVVVKRDPYQRLLSIWNWVDWVAFNIFDPLV